MLQELLQLADRTLLLVQAGALLLTAAAMAANQRTLLQRYLDRGLTGTAGGAQGLPGLRCRMLRCWPPVLSACLPACLLRRPAGFAACAGWHQLKHGSRAARGTKDEKRTLGDVIRMHCQVGWR